MPTPSARRLDEKHVLITGAGAGIGRASALLFAQHGANVVADIDRVAADETVELIVTAGGHALAIEANVGEAASVQAMVDVALEKIGYVDVLFNNAGIGKHGNITAVNESDWDHIMSVTLKSVFLCSRALIPHFLERGRGTILNTASTYGILAARNFPLYCTAKAGVIMLTKSLALDYGPEIRVNCICPGVTSTSIIQSNIARASDPAAEIARLSNLNGALQRIAEPIEIANAALFLASDEASFVTGSAFVVDGGQTIDA